MKITCPHCGSETGFYTRERVSGTATVYYTNTGDCRNDQTQMYDYLSHSGGKNAYCSCCDKYIGKSEKLISGIAEEEETF